MLSYLSSLPISVLRSLDTEANTLEINRYNHPYQIISRTVKYQSFVINIMNLFGPLFLISINLFLILISKLVPLTLELARTLNMYIWLQVMLLRAI